MKPLAKSGTKRVVEIGSVWVRIDPNGQRQTFEVSHFCLNPYGNRCAKGRLASGRIVTLNIVAMENGDPRFEHVHDEYVRRTGS